MANQFIIFSLISLAFCCIAFASDPGSLQDFCVADTSSSVKVNGVVCKNASLVTASDFSFSGLHITGNTSNILGFLTTRVFVDQIPGLNTLGIAMARVDYAPFGLNPPHTHPRATEIVTVLEGTFEVGIVTSNPENRLIAKVLQKGDVFVVPEGLVHYARNIGNVNGVIIAAFSSQNPGLIIIADAVFGSNPPIPTEVLTKAFQLDKKTVDYLQATF